MTVTTVSRRSELYIANGVTRDWVFPFFWYDLTTLKLFVRNASGLDVEVDPADYAVTPGPGNIADGFLGGTIRYPVLPLPSLAAGNKVYIVRELRTTQLSLNLTLTSGYDPRLIERAIDENIMLLQQALDGVIAAGVVRTARPEDSYFLPNPEGNKLIGWTSDGLGLENKIPAAGFAVNSNGHILQTSGGIGAGSLSDAEINLTSGVGAPLSDVLRWGGDIRAYGAGNGSSGAAVMAAIDRMADDTGGVVIIPEGVWSCPERYERTNSHLVMVGRGHGVSILDCNGSTGGFGMTDTTNTVDEHKSLIARDLTFRTNKIGFKALTGAWRALPFSTSAFADFRGLEFRTAAENSPENWDRCIEVENCIGGTFDAIKAVNRVGAVAGAAIAFKGFCLNNAVSRLTAQYFSSGILATPLTVQSVGFSSQTANFAAGEIITTSGGAVGVMLSPSSDAGATGVIVVAVYSGTFTVGHTMTGSFGGNGVISTVTASLYAGEGYYVDDVETVGCQWGFQADNTGVIKRGFGFEFGKFHANNTLGGIKLAECAQISITAGNFYALGTGVVGVQARGVQNMTVMGGNYVGNDSIAGTKGVELLTPASGNNSEINIIGAQFSKIATGIVIPAATVGSQFVANQGVTVGVLINNAAALAPLIAAGVRIFGNVENGAVVSDSFLGPDGALYSMTAAPISFRWWNSARKLRALMTASGELRFEDETNGAVRLTLPVGGGIKFSPPASIDPGANGEMVIQATSNTALALKLRGSDGVIRTVTLTLA